MSGRTLRSLDSERAAVASQWIDSLYQQRSEQDLRDCWPDLVKIARALPHRLARNGLISTLVAMNSTGSGGEQPVLHALVACLDGEDGYRAADRERRLRNLVYCLHEGTAGDLMRKTHEAVQYAVWLKRMVLARTPAEPPSEADSVITTSVAP